MANIPTPDNRAKRKLFHNEWINVYPTTLSLDEIHFWPENNRTIFTFERLERLKDQKLVKISIEEITRFVAEQDIHKLEILADSIERNGVQIPLIIRDDGKLLDGNRRFFACQWLKMLFAECGEKQPDCLSQIPVDVIRKADLKGDLELKILAEANFIPDLKVPWPLDAQARAVDAYYEQIVKAKKIDRETALAEVVSVFGIERQRAVDLLGALDLTKKFIDDAGDDKDGQIKRRAIVEEKFVYFWEFLNKATKGRRAYSPETEAVELKEVTGMFFQLMAKGRDNPIANVKQVEPLAQSRRDKDAWEILKESKGAKLSVVVSIMNDKKEVRKAEDKIRVFLAWLKGINELTSNAKAYLKEVAKLAGEKSRD